MRRKLLTFILTLATVLTVAGFWLYNRPLSELKPQVTLSQPVAAQAAQLPWPNYSQAAFGAVGFGVLASNNASSPVPIASIAKVITALAILKEKPLQPGEQGPLITITDADVQAYNEYLVKDGSVLPVKVGEQISEYQALQAMMLPSANDIADTAARWAFNSIDNYVAYANQFVKNLGMIQTAVTDASGFSQQTVSTAKDLILLGEAALKNPLLAQIVNQSEAEFPGAGTIKNINWLLGSDGIVGIKTGNTDQAGGCFLLAAKRLIANQPVVVIGAFLGGPTRDQAMNDARNFIVAADRNFEVSTAVIANQAVGRYNLPWGGSIEAIASNDLKMLNWKPNPKPINVKLENVIIPSSKDLVVGSVKASSADTKPVLVLLKDPVPPPPETWRIWH